MPSTRAAKPFLRTPTAFAAGRVAAGWPGGTPETLAGLDSGHTRSLAPMSVLILVPAHNEARNLPAVVRDIRTQHATHDILIVDDGSDDDTAELLPQLGVRWLGLVYRMGLGGAIRTGMRYAHAHGFKIVVRLDGD